jgi:hypothetical protein
MFSIPVEAQDSYVSDPGNIPYFDNFSVPEIKPGDEGKFKFTITNKYEYDIDDVRLTIGIYAYATIDDFENLDEIPYAPIINNEDSEYIYTLGKIGNNTKINMSFLINTFDGTLQGSYFVRFQLNFNYTGTEYVMKSRGHFTKKEWDNATLSGELSDPGNINIEALGVDGILPDSSFLVNEPMPMWPLYAMVVAMVVIGTLAIIFFAIEEYRMFPRLEKGFHYGASKFHQFWRFFKHRKS